ncbi:MAG TPA: ATP-binding protein, partial [Algoriphagus sp.]|nr:ATP-binding protein [Algoriphagus sp.]
IEAGLERIRARTMGMQKSVDLRQVVKVLYSQLKELGFDQGGAAINIMDPDSGDIDSWGEGYDDGYDLPEKYHVPYSELPGLRELIMHWKSGAPYSVVEIAGQEKKSLDNYYFFHTEFTKVPETTKQFMKQREDLVFSMAYMRYGALTWTPSPISEDQAKILQRFAKVFEQSYTRFIDLQKAEAQDREAQIEAALEKVRSRTMAMQHSDELAEAAFVLFQQLQALGIVHERINIGIVKEESNTIDFWITEQGGNQVNTRFSGRIDEPTTLSKMYSGWKKNQKFMVIDQTGDDLENWLRYLKEDIGIPFDPAFLHHRRVQTVGFFSKGMLVVTTPEPLPEENLGLLVKFAGVFDLTYTRFSDLKQAEAQAREAQIEVALERIRTRALAMQSSTELSDVANVLREQMGILGQEDLQASVVHLYSADSPTFDSWYAFRAGDKIIEGQTTFRLENSALAKEFLRLYLDEITDYTIEAKGSELEEWLAEIKRNAPQIAAYWGDLPPEKQFYHFSDFSGGALLMVSHQNLSEETRMLQKRCSLVFELAYKRFLDLEAKERQDMELREEKLRLEKALSELKATQSQLIQSEKMASLGQLTAGIAHEIKNPLNFVNNFSEVSIELIGEIQEERDKIQEERDETLIGEILEDIKSNLRKVHEHGTRADGIVKSMLQHSRSSGNNIESKAFNPIVKEFANLAFHGMRAGKAPINVEIDLQLDPEVGEVKLISDDFSRVILNLCNNAFDAMRDKLLEATTGKLNYSPKLTIFTKRTSETEIQLTIGDNGKGIPEDIMDKILEPFFTTKKGTEGTGLGLSISYDIIKAHGGKLEVRSKLGIGTEFIIQIPTDF